VSARRIRFTANAEQHLEQMRAWWRNNRDNQAIFEIALEQALTQISTLPGSGSSYSMANISGLRRIHISKIDCHLYYTSDGRSVVVQALWGARRGKGPTF
jgi:hypothetical protein